jgi:hypothetical protein
MLIVVSDRIPVLLGQPTLPQPEPGHQRYIVLARSRLFCCRRYQ